MDLKSFVGQKAGPYRKAISREHLQDFSRAVGAKPTPEAAPTFVTICRQGEFDLFQKMGIPLSKVLHAEQEYVYESPVMAGDTLVFETSVTQVLTKKGSLGSMHFMSLETAIYAERPEGQVKAVDARSTVVIRAK